MPDMWLVGLLQNGHVSKRSETKSVAEALTLVDGGAHDIGFRCEGARPGPILPMLTLDPKAAVVVLVIDDPAHAATVGRSPGDAR